MILKDLDCETFGLNDALDMLADLVPAMHDNRFDDEMLQF
jgi:hypothetical protein